MNRIAYLLSSILLVIASLSAQPRISRGPDVDSLAADAMKITWTSLLPGTSKLLFGRGESLTDSVESLAEVRDHAVVITGLDPGTIYAFQAFSSNATGTSFTTMRYGVTPSPASSGVIESYFNFSVDASLPFGEAASGNVNLGQKILERINAAAHSIDLALYSFSDYTSSAPDIALTLANALVAAKNRGVKVRMVYDDRSNTIPVNTLINAGIPVSKRDVTVGIMHNKFWLFDVRDSSSVLDDWVVMGSWNVTDGGTYLEAQNALFIQDRSLGVVYTKEFEEMFGSSGDTPNAAAARFGPEKLNNTPHWTWVGNTRVDIYFSPSDGTNSSITSALGTADHNIFFALLVFTRDDLAAMIQSRASAGVVVKGIINDINVQGSEYQPLVDAGLDVRKAAKANATAFVLHHKYGIVDPFNDGSDPLVITGSHNWSSAAEGDNDENTLIIHSGSLARQYVREFSSRYGESGGTGPVVSVAGTSLSVPEQIGLSEAFPNPFNPSTTVTVSLPSSSPIRLIVTDMLGRHVFTVAEGAYEQGVHQFRWEPQVTSGMYLLVLRTPSSSSVRKLLFLK